MKFFGWVAVLVFVTLLAGGVVAAILVLCNPFQIAEWIFYLFYPCLFISITGLFTLAGWLIRRLIRCGKRLSSGQSVHYLKISFRQGCLLALILTSLLFLQAQGLLFWWNFFGLVLIVSLLEWYLAG